MIDLLLRRACVKLTLLLLLSFSGMAFADDLDLAQFSLTQLTSSSAASMQMRLRATLPEDADPNAAVSLPASCELLGRDASVTARTFIVDLLMDCEYSTTGQIQTAWAIDGGVFELVSAEGHSTTLLLSGGRPGALLTIPDWQTIVAQPQPGFWETAWRYLELGTVHVLIGWDHLAFVFCISLLASGMPLLWLITAFTVGHSISLALSHFGLLNLPIAPVEAVIALSVVFMAREALLMHRSHLAANTHAHARSFNWRMGIVAGFGLIHGLGFASVLSGLGVNASETVTALAFFNIGVEIGQVLFVAAVLTSLYLLRKIRLERYMIQAASYGIGAIGVLWTVERVVS